MDFCILYYKDRENVLLQYLKTAFVMKFSNDIPLSMTVN